MRGNNVYWKNQFSPRSGKSKPCIFLPVRFSAVQLKKGKGELTVVNQQGGIPGQSQLGVCEGGVRGVLWRGSIAQTRGLLVKGVLVGVLRAVAVTGWVLALRTTQTVRRVQPPLGCNFKKHYQIARSCAHINATQVRDEFNKRIQMVVYIYIVYIKEWIQ